MIRLYSIKRFTSSLPLHADGFNPMHTIFESVMRSAQPVHSPVKMIMCNLCERNQMFAEVLSDIL